MRRRERTARSRRVPAMARHSDSGLTSWIDSRVAIRAGKGEPAAARVGWRGCRRLRMLRLHAARPGWSRVVHVRCVESLLDLTLLCLLVAHHSLPSDWHQLPRTLALVPPEAPLYECPGAPPSARVPPPPHLACHTRSPDTTCAAHSPSPSHSLTASPAAREPPPRTSAPPSRLLLHPPLAIPPRQPRLHRTHVVHHPRPRAG